MHSEPLPDITHLNRSFGRSFGPLSRNRKYSSRMHDWADLFVLFVCVPRGSVQIFGLGQRLGGKALVMDRAADGFTAAKTDAAEEGRNEGRKGSGFVIRDSSGPNIVGTRLLTPVAAGGKATDAVEMVVVGAFTVTTLTLGTSFFASLVFREIQRDARGE